jgi:hypothetical protein
MKIGHDNSIEHGGTIKQRFRKLNQSPKTIGIGSKMNGFKGFPTWIRNTQLKKRGTWEAIRSSY